MSMPRIPILKLGSSAEAPPPRLSAYSPALSLDGLQLGIDNVRHDVWLSPSFTKAAGAHIGKLIAKYGNVEVVMSAEGASSPHSPKNIFSRVVPALAGKNADLKPLLVDVHRTAVGRAKTEGNPALDLLARAAVIKFLRSELNAQFASALERCRTTLKGYEGVRQQKALEYREKVAAFQIAKKNILRQVGQDLFRLLREIDRETLATMRRSLFGDEAADYQVFLNQLIFLEEGRDSHLAAQHYVLIGGFENDPDSFGNIRAIAGEFLKAVAPEAENAGSALLDSWLNSPENAHELVGTGDPNERAYKARLQLWTELLQRDRVLDFVTAAYEVVPLLPEFTPLLDPQQLKYALVGRKERERVEKLVEEHGKLSLRSLASAGERVAQSSGAQRAKIAARFLRDFLRYHRDLRRLEVLNGAIEKINLINSEKLRDLSRVNGTLYSFLLTEEARSGAQEKPIVRHVVLKADIRDSSRLTRSLLERGMNPASYFSLNFYDPVNKLLCKYGATKVFVEGDAIILAILEHEGEASLSVSRACVLAREMMEIVGGYNHLLQRAGLPALELGIGVSYQDSAPMYLLDGEHRIMISDALNESDRLSSCDKKMRKVMAGMGAPFNIYEFRAGETAESEPMRYNVGGIRMSEAAFKRLQEEISLEQCALQFARLWGSEEAGFSAGLVPVGADIFRRVVVRASKVPIIQTKDFSLVSWTETPIYEVCSNPAVYAAMENSAKAGN
jgi:hypothetical protein